MIIDLPKRIPKTEAKIVLSNSYIRNHTLYIRKSSKFKRNMYRLTYYMKGNQYCSYCGKIVSDREMTLDHMYPQDFGGPTITNNLLPACASCNVEKSNMTRKQYQTFLKLKEKGKKVEKNYLEEVLKEQEKKRKAKQIDLPEGWITLWNVNNIITDTYTDVKYGRKYKKIERYYQKYGYFQKPIIISKNRFLLDGFNQLLFAKENHIKKIPTIVLENVIIVN